MYHSLNWIKSLEKRAVTSHLTKTKSKNKTVNVKGELIYRPPPGKLFKSSCPSVKCLVSTKTYKNDELSEEIAFYQKILKLISHCNGCFVVLIVRTSSGNGNGTSIATNKHH